MIHVVKMLRNMHYEKEESSFLNS